MIQVTMGRHISKMHVLVEAEDTAHSAICPLCCLRHGKANTGPREVALEHCQRCIELVEVAKQLGIDRYDHRYNVKSLTRMSKSIAARKKRKANTPEPLTIQI